MTTEFKNMKIEINNDLDEIVAQLERLGYENYGDLDGCDFVFTTDQLAFIGWTNDCRYADDFVFAVTTIAELKRMK